jgi:phosphate transport system substrate-binding protein
MHKAPAKPENAKEVLKFFDWAYSDEGDKLASSLDYVPLPGPVIDQIKTAWKSQIKDAGGKEVW